MQRAQLAAMARDGHSEVRSLFRVSNVDDRGHALFIFCFPRFLASGWIEVEKLGLKLGPIWDAGIPCCLIYFIRIPAPVLNIFMYNFFQLRDARGMTPFMSAVSGRAYPAAITILETAQKIAKGKS